MNLTTAEIKPDCDIYLPGDTHFGSTASSEHSVLDMIERIKKNKSAYWIHMGDWIEAIMVDDKRFNYKTTKTPVPLQQADEAIEIFRPIADKCILGLTGNHELTLEKYGNLAEYICKNLKTFYGGYSAVITFTIKKKQVFKMFLAHGIGGPLRSNSKDSLQAKANKLAALKLRMAKKLADCLVMAMGHTHQLLCVEPEPENLIITSDSKKLKQQYLSHFTGTESYIPEFSRWYINTGSFLRTYVIGETTYSERAGYDPIVLGYPIIRVRKGRVVKVDLETIV